MVDAAVRGRPREQLRAVHERTRIAMILVTHDLAEVRALADSLVVYAAGRVLQVGPTTDVLRALAAAALDRA